MRQKNQYYEDNERVLAEMDAALNEARLENQQLSTAQKQILNQVNEDNIAKWQLSLKEELEEIYHLIRGDTRMVDDKGNEYWEPDKDAWRPFNEHGVKMLMTVIKSYVIKNTILSNYDEETINAKMYDFQIELADFIYLNSYDMGMDTPEKERSYPMIVKMVVDSVHSAYNRALHGQERSSLRKMINVNQTDSIGGRSGNVPIVSQHKSGLSRVLPWNWGR